MASGEKVKLNIGGKVFQTTRSTLTKYDCYFRAMFESNIPPALDESGCIFIDRSHKNFDVILNFLRDGDTPIPECAFQKKQLLKEAQYYTLDGLIYLCGGEPSEEWQKEHLDTKYLRNWRRANWRAEIQFSSNDKEYKDFCRYCFDKFSLKIDYNSSYWGEIRENVHVQNFVKKYNPTWNIIFCHFKCARPTYYIRRPDKNFACGFGKSTVPELTAQEFIDQVDEDVRKNFSN